MFRRAADKTVDDKTLESMLEDSLRQEERDGLRLAVKGRLVALAAIGAFALFAFQGGLLYNTLVYVAAFAALSLAQLALSGTQIGRPWFKYLFVLLEVSVLAYAVITPNPFNPSPWPMPMVYRYDNFMYFFVLLAVAAFSYSPGVVLWTGIAVALVWGLGFAWVMSDPQALTLADAAAGAGSDEVLAHFVDPHVVIQSARVKEMLVAVIVAGLLSVVVWRGRRMVERQVRGEREREFIHETFGKYVPEAVAKAIIADRGMLKPEHRTGTILFADIQDFTAIAEGMRPEEVVSMLNAYFGVVAEIIMQHGGVINQFQGDAILATFNIPLEDRDHASHAVRAALSIQRTVQTSRFADRDLRSRIGINTGSVVAGAVGGSGRLNYTVHGDVVNLAARLEQLNKTYDSCILVTEDTVHSAGNGFPFEPVGTVPVRGKSVPVTLYRLTPATQATQPKLRAS